MGGETLEWATTSPPPEYNFASIPVVRSATPNWDRGDRAEDGRRLARGELVLDEGHQAMSSTVLDADADKVLEMPPESWWPLLLALSLAVFFVLFLHGNFVFSSVGLGLAGLCLVGWFGQGWEEL